MLINISSSNNKSSKTINTNNPRSHFLIQNYIKHITDNNKNFIPSHKIKKKTLSSKCVSSETMKCEYLRTEPTPTSTANTTKWMHNDKSKKVNSFKSIDLSTDSLETPSHNTIYISHQDLLKQNYKKVSLDILKEHFDCYSNAKFSLCNNGIFSSYGVNISQGLFKKYNEDRIGIAINIPKPKNYNGIWPLCSIFCIFDGHYGSGCANFLKDNLIKYIIQNKYFPNNPYKALQYGYNKAEEAFCEQQMINDNIDESGSCALITLIIDDMVYVANVGDSIALIGANDGQYTVLSEVHRPEEPEEKKRIEQNGGNVYQEKIPLNAYIINNNSNNVILYGPYRVNPGNLSISRSIGDIKIKNPIFDGKKGVVIPTPSIRTYHIKKNETFIFMGSDGIFDVMTHDDVTQGLILSMKNKKNAGECVDIIIKTALQRKSTDNLSGIFIKLVLNEYQDKEAFLSQEVTLDADYISDDDNKKYNFSFEPTLSPHNEIKKTYKSHKKIFQ